MRYFVTKDNVSMGIYDEESYQNADHTGETLLAKYTKEEYAKLEQPIRLVNGKLQFGYTEEEKQEMTRQEEIQRLKQFLKDTDNYALRISTGEAQPDDYSETYKMTFAEIMQKRKEARARLAELEN